MAGSCGVGAVAEEGDGWIIGRRGGTWTLLLNAAYTKLAIDRNRRYLEAHIIAKLWVTYTLHQSNIFPLPPIHLPTQLPANVIPRLYGIHSIAMMLITMSPP